MELKPQPLFKFLYYRVTKASFEIKNPNDDNNPARDLNVEMNPIANFLSDKKFSVSFDLKVFSDDKDISVEVQATAYFSTQEVITDEFKNSDLVKMNIPAIVFPYLRAFISSVTVNSGFNPIILPPYNFTVFGKAKNTPAKK